MKFKTLILGFSFFLSFPLATSIHAADIYQWTDENGKVHFGDKPPRDKPAENISKSAKSVNVDSSTAEREKVGKIFAPITAEEQALQQQQAQKEANRQTLLQQSCDKAREELHFYQTKRFYWVDEEGNQSHATEAERKQKIEELTAAIAKHCS